MVDLFNCLLIENCQEENATIHDAVGNVETRLSHNLQIHYTHSYEYVYNIKYFLLLKYSEN